MNRNRKLIASLVGIVALTNTVMPVCAEPSDTLVHANVTSINEGKKEKEQGNINLLDPSVGLVSNSNNMNNNEVFYQIQPNDTLSSIAKANNTTVEKLMETTGLTDPNKIKVGDILVSPYITEEFVLSKGQDPKQNEKKRAKVGEVVKHELTQSDRNILRSLFNAKEYAKMYPDVAKTYKHFTNPIMLEQKLFEHFINWGIWEGRQPSESFSVAAYASAYSDLRKSFGSHIVEYYKHYYNTTVIGNENRTITTIQKAQDEGIKVTDFFGNTVAVDEAGNIVTGEKAEKIAAEKNLGTPIGSVITTIPNVTVSADFNEETEEKEETQAPSSEDKKEPSAPVTPTKTFAEAYKEWLASEPVGGSGNVYLIWYDKKPKLADYADGREFLAKKEAWEKKKPDYDAYLAKTAYASDYAAWQAREPKLADYTILIGNQTATEKYNEDYAAWQELAPKPEDYIQYTSFEADYKAWLDSAPVPVEGKYETAEKAKEAYNEAHREWEANAPKQLDYFDEEGYNNAVTEWTNNAPKKENYYDEEGYATAVENYNNSKPKRENYIDNEAYSNAMAMHENEKPEWEDYFKQDEYMVAQDAYTDYCNQLEAYENYRTAKAEYDAAYSKWKEDNAEFFEIEEINKTRREEYEAALAEYNKYIAYKNWEEATLEDYMESGLITYVEHKGQYYYRYINVAGSTCLDSNPNDAVSGVKRATQPEYYDTSNPVEEPEEPTYEQLPEGVIDPGEFTQVEPTEVEEPDPVDNPDDNHGAYLTASSINGGAMDKDSAMDLYNNALDAWKAGEPKKEDFQDTASYHIALEEWRDNEPNEWNYFNNETYNNMEEAKAAYNAALAAAGSKPMEEDFFGDKAKEANITDKEAALKVFEEDTASYTEESPEPTEEEYTSNVITEEEKAEFEQAVEDYNAAEPSATDSKYVEEAKETEEYKETVAKHEADKPDQSTYVDDIYETETDAVNAHEEDHRDWEGEKPSEYDYIINTTYADDLEVWVDSEPDFNEYFGIEAQE